MIQYNDARWIECFKVNKDFVFQLIEKLTHFMEEKDIHYKCVMLVGIQIACALYKLVHRVGYFHCNEMFTISKSTIQMVLQKFVHVMNVVFKNKIKWPKGKDLKDVMVGFKKICDFPSIHNAINVIQICTQNLQVAFTKHYFSFKSKTYNM
jgi:hypothetical protein